MIAMMVRQFVYKPGGNEASLTCLQAAMGVHLYTTLIVTADKCGIF